MESLITCGVGLALLSLAFPSLSAAQHLHPGRAFMDQDTPRVFPKIASAREWRGRAEEIRQQILVSCGLWPMPARTPIEAHIFGRIQREGYSVEKVYFQPLPGFHLAGNLYRPLGKGPGPFPGVLNPHGHWKEGRLADMSEGSVPARCISFARQGMVAFSYDMVGFNDTHFRDSATNRPFYEVHRQFGSAPDDQLWNISLMGLQTWNSIRALDFLESLPDVDAKRLACTGASGGGTQTYMLGAVDDRLAAQAPVVMVSHTMQGGCSCENAPGLRVEYSNLEFAAAAAPRPQLLVAASGDWTKDTLTVEGPAIAQIYQLLGSPEKLKYVRFDFGHNYNQTSREAVYAWFGQWLQSRAGVPPAGQAQGGTPPGMFKEAPYQKEADADLRVFPDGRLPEGALTQAELIGALKKQHSDQWRALLPTNKTGLKTFREKMLPAWRHTLQLEWPSLTTSAQSSPPEGSFFCGAAQAPRILVILAYPTRPQAWLQNNRLSGLAAELQKQKVPFLALEPVVFVPPPDLFGNFFTTYNRTEAQEQVRRLAEACAYARKALKARKLVLCGIGRAGLWCLLAAPVADAVIADCDGLDVDNDDAMLAPDLFCPGIRNTGGFEGAAMLAAPHPLLVHDTGPHFSTAALRTTYQAAGALPALRIERAALPEVELARWIAAVCRR